MVLHKLGEKLYLGVESIIKEHMHQVAQTKIATAFPQRQTSTALITSNVNTLSSSSSSNTLRLNVNDNKAGSAPGSLSMNQKEVVVGLIGGTEFLQVLNSAWEDHTTCMSMIRDILLYMVNPM